MNGRIPETRANRKMQKEIRERANLMVAHLLTGPLRSIGLAKSEYFALKKQYFSLKRKLSSVDSNWSEDLIGRNHHFRPEEVKKRLASIHPASYGYSALCRELGKAICFYSGELERLTA